MERYFEAGSCGELEQKLIELKYSDDSMRRYGKVFRVETLI
jgi:hypothetical protein